MGKITEKSKINPCFFGQDLKPSYLTKENSVLTVIDSLIFEIVSVESSYRAKI
jgi:hypothetical protein